MDFIQQHNKEFHLYLEHWLEMCFITQHFIEVLLSKIKCVCYLTLSSVICLYFYCFLFIVFHHGASVLLVCPHCVEQQETCWNI